MVTAETSVPQSLFWATREATTVRALIEGQRGGPGHSPQLEKAQELQRAPSTAPEEINQ